MTTHNHGYDPSCPETKQADGTLKGDCMNTEKLDPCKHCGGEAFRDTNFGRKARTCHTCWISIRGDLSATDEELDAAWNRRHHPVDATAMVAPRLWDAETIKDAPDIGGALIWGGDWEGWVWCGSDADSTPMQTAKRLVSQSGHGRVFGPMPEPPVSGAIQKGGEG